MTNGILKYSIDDLVKMLKNIIGNEEIHVISEKYKVDEIYLKEILERPQILTFEMYEILEVILKMDIDELTKIIEFEEIKKFRADNLDEESNKDIELAENIFKEIISNYKLGGI